ncbi:MAG: hypothetical protein IJE15_06300, partial [Bacteroidaceae bacterium]|nr:hypothetical protein [Bacteroidaceae bacterium]
HAKDKSRQVRRNKNDPTGQGSLGVKRNSFSGVNATSPSGVKRTRLFQLSHNQDCGRIHISMP